MSEDAKKPAAKAEKTTKPRTRKTAKGADALAQQAVESVNTHIAQQAAAASDEPQVIMHQHFLNDLSIENPVGVLDARAAEAKLGQRIQVEVAPRQGDMASFQPGEPTHQVTLGVQLSAELGGKVIYLAEMRYRALVEVRNLTPEQVEPALFVMIPEAIYPAVKEVMERTGGYAGYPALTVQPMDFAMIYSENKKKTAAKDKPLH